MGAIPSGVVSYPFTTNIKTDEIGDLMQDCSNSSVNALELLLPCPMPAKYSHGYVLIGVVMFLLVMSEVKSYFFSIFLIIAFMALGRSNESARDRAMWLELLFNFFIRSNR